MKRTKRLLSLLLILVLLLGVLPVSSYAAERPQNLARAATASAISERTVHPVLPASMVKDGVVSDTSRWSVAPEDDNADMVWLALSWDALQTFDTLRICEYSERTKKLEVYVSDSVGTVKDEDAPDRLNAAIQWERVYEEEKQDDQSTAIGKNRAVLLDKSCSARHLLLKLWKKDAGNNQVGISELEVYRSVEGNLARWAQITASSQHPQFPAENLLDARVDVTGNDSRWSSHNETGDISVTLKWDTEQTFDAVVLYEWDTRTQRVKLETSGAENGDDWELFAEHTSIGAKREFTKDDDKTDVTARRLRVTLTPQGANNMPGLSELEVFLREADSTPTPPPTPADPDDNLALSSRPHNPGTASASSQHSAGGGTYYANKLNDGDRNTRWSATDDDTPPLWVQIAWNEPVTFDTVTLVEAFAGRAKDVKFYTSNDETVEWKALTPQATLAAMNGEATVTFDNTVTAKYLRIYTDRVGDSSKQPGFSELEVYDRSSVARIESFRIGGSDGAIDHDAGTIRVSTDEDELTALTPTVVTTKGASYTPQGAQDFTNPVTYTVTAKDSVSTKAYTVTVTKGGWLGHGDLSDAPVADIATFGATPTPNQYRYQKAELAAFLHFGINTFNGEEWTPRQVDPAIFTLNKKVEADSYVKLLKDAGFERLIVVSKHHDGFQMFEQERSTDVNGTDYGADYVWKYGIPRTNYPGDVLEHLSEACSKYDMNMGLYLSPWDAAAPHYGYYKDKEKKISADDPAEDLLDYNKFYDGHLNWILGSAKYGNKGRFVEVWMDGAKGKGADAQDYDFDKWINTIQTRQGKKAGRDDDVLLFGAGKYTTVRWIGNENGLAPEPCWSKGSATYNPDGSVLSLNNGPKVGEYYPGIKTGNHWVVPECDARITSGWFWGNNKKTPKTLTALRDMYLQSVGRNSVLLLNVPLNDQGTLDQAIYDRTKEFGENIQQTFHKNLIEEPGVTITADSVHENNVKFSPIHVADKNYGKDGSDGKNVTYWAAQAGTKTASLRVNFGREVTFDVVTIEEEINHGQRIESFTIQYRNGTGAWTDFGSGQSVGARRIVLDYPVRATELKVTLTGMTDNGVTAAPVISQLGAYKASKGFEKGSGAPDGLNEIDSASTQSVTPGAWQTVNDRRAVGGSYLHGDAGSGELQVKFTGTYAILKGGSENARYTLQVDDGEPHELRGTHALDEWLGEVGDPDTLTDGEHTLKIKVLEGAVNFDALYALNNGGKGLLDFEQGEYEEDEGKTLKVTVVRKGGTAGTLDAVVEPNPGSAIQKHFDTDPKPISFADGDTAKTVQIALHRDTDATGPLQFTLDITPGLNETGLITGVWTPVTVTIRDLEEGLDAHHYVGIRVTKQPDKLEYTKDEMLDTTGMVVSDIYQTPIYTGSGLGRRKEIKLPQPVTASSLRLLLKSIDQGVEPPCLNEVEVYNGAATGINLARSATASANSWHQNANLPPSKIIDGDTSDNSRWAAAGQAMPVWVQLDWTAPQTFDTIVIYEWKNQYESYWRAKDYELLLPGHAGSQTMIPLSAAQYEVSPTTLDTVGDMIDITVTKKGTNYKDTFQVKVTDTVTPPAPTVTGYDVTPTELSSDGGEITVTLTGTNLQNGIHVKAADNITGTTTGTPVLQEVTLTLPKNEGAQPMTYTVQYSLDGNDWMNIKTVIVKAPTVTPPAPTVNRYEVTPTVLPSDGGEIMVRLIGTDLQNGIHVKAADGITDTTEGTSTAQAVTLTLPANTGNQPMTYTVQYSLNGNDWMGSIAVIVQAPTITPPAPSGGGSNASVGRPSVREDAGQSQAAAEQTHFIDVLRDSWYYSSVYSAHENGLIDGVGGRRFDPDATLTVAQAIKLSAALHQLDRTGEVSLKNGAGNWYDSYVSYAIANSILEERYADYSREQMNAPVTRGEFVHIFHGALEHYEQINTVADNAIPDVKLGDVFAAEIYELYRAGILHGNDTAGTFRPESTIKRSEAAAILLRMFEPSARKSFTLK